VYFVRGSEPYMTIAVPIERFAGDVIGVLQAEVNLKYIGDVVSNLKIGQAGYSYVISRSGELIAHPDISLVLQRRNVAKLESTKAAFTPAADRPKRQALVTPNVQGKKVLTASAQVSGLDWAVIVDRPVEEDREVGGEEMSRGYLGVGQLRAQRREVERAEERRDERRGDDRRARVVDEARERQLGRSEPAARRRRPLVDAHGEPGAGKGDRRRQAVRSAADDDRVESVVGDAHRLRIFGARQ
jgi:hypothetical protein